MHHRIYGSKLSRTKNERRRLLQSLTREVIIHGRIQTTLAKAKAVQPVIEKIITKAKNGDRISIIQIRKILADKNSVNHILNDAKTRFSGRTSGYTRIYKTGNRSSDSATMAILEFVDNSLKTESLSPGITSKIPVIKKPLSKTTKSTENPKQKHQRIKSGKK